VKLNIFFALFKLVPAINDAVSEVTKALSKSSPGGKKVTVAEVGEIVDAVVLAIRPILTEEFTKQFKVK
jgi:hypothetical protein